MEKSKGRNRETREFGDFQTPEALASAVCATLNTKGIKPDLILEPTCGRGSFLSAAAEAFPQAHLVGVEKNSEHLAAARAALASVIAVGRVELRGGDFFEVDWDSVLDKHVGSWLILGNPPWVTNAALGALTSRNTPRKSNFHKRSGIEAITGKSNFDISEWMLLQYLDWLRERGGSIAVLVKTLVARRVLAEVWKSHYPVDEAAIYLIDAMKHFGAAVDACLLVVFIAPNKAASSDCLVFGSLLASTPLLSIGFHDGFVVSDVLSYQRWQHLAGQDQGYVWRSGIKHDCSSIMELTRDDGQYRNGLGEYVEMEDALVYPLLKSSDVNNGKLGRRRVMIVTQKTAGEDTAHIQVTAPQTWSYLQRHRSRFSNRRSSIYRNRPPFSIFGVGEYTFAPWKVAISGFYKSLCFASIGPIEGRPSVFDDTVYFLSCHSEEEANFLTGLLNSTPAQEFYRSMVFWSDKRPVTLDLLKRLSIARLASELGLATQYIQYAQKRDQSYVHVNHPFQPQLF